MKLFRTRHRPRKTSPALSHISAAWLLATATVTVLPHGFNTLTMPLWVIGIAAVLLGWALVRSLRRVATPPHRLLIAGAGLAACGAVFAHFGYFFGKDPGVALLAVLLCLKMLESRTARDARAALLLAFFLQLGLFFEDQTLPIAVLAALGATLATTTLISLHDRHAPPAQQFRSASTLVLQAVPLLLIFFIAFPRVPGPLWGAPISSNAGRTGLSDTMEPGSISQLAESSEIALRARFEGAIPPPIERYWRGPVLSHFNGRRWEPSFSPPADTPTYTPTGPAYRYEMTLEAHNRNWLLALDYPAAGVGNARYTGDFQLLSWRMVRNRQRIDITSYPHTRVGLEESPHAIRAALRLPENRHPRTTELTQTLIADIAQPEERLRRLIDYFRTQDFIYTLNPPLLTGDAIDGFLFETQQGFCEHFSAAFVVMARVAGLPARVVTGYQGGEINPVDGVMIVRQSDAHAWAEVWLEGQGWQRVDPTYIANPLRIDGGLNAVLAESGMESLLMRPSMRWLRNLRNHWEAINNEWNQFILGYDADRQRDLFERLGFRMPDWRTYIGLLSASVTGLLLLLFAWALHRARTTDPVLRAGQALERRLARIGLARKEWEGPLDYARRAASARPAHATPLAEVCTEYARLRYAAPAPDHAERARALLARIRKLDLR